MSHVKRAESSAWGSHDVAVGYAEKPLVQSRMLGLHCDVTLVRVTCCRLTHNDELRTSFPAKDQSGNLSHPFSFVHPVKTSCPVRYVA
jgi:hypothetical protein